MQDFPPSIKPVANPEFELCATIAGGDGTDMVLIPYDRSLLLSIRGKQEMMALHSGIKLVGSFASQDSGGDFGVDYTDLGGGRVQVDTTFLPTNHPTPSGCLRAALQCPSGGSKRSAARRGRPLRCERESPRLQPWEYVSLARLAQCPSDEPQRYAQQLSPHRCGA